MPFYVKIGNLPKYRHTFDKDVYFEEVISSESFDGPYSILYHNKEPTNFLEYEIRNKDAKMEEKYISQHSHILTQKIKGNGDFAYSRKYLFGNDYLSIGISRVNKAGDYLMRFGNRHLLAFVHQGDGLLETNMGSLNYFEHDYILIPKGVLFRFIPKGETFLFFVESGDSINFPQRYVNGLGQLKLQSPISDRNIRIPELKYSDLPVKKIIVDSGNEYLEYIPSSDPRDLVGWDGTYYPFALNALDQMPWVGKIHLPPPVHQTFDSKHFMVATFLPRPFDFHERAIPISFYHSNVDVEEILFYSSGNFMSRKGIKKGSITIHVRNLTHGPHPGKYKESIGKEWTDELAVMLEVYDRIKFYKGTDELLDKNYMSSWREE